MLVPTADILGVLQSIPDKNTTGAVATEKREIPEKNGHFSGISPERATSLELATSSLEGWCSAN